MAHDVFISYSSKDKPVADAVCATLEGRRVRCWVAPRDVLPGLPYGEAIVDAIQASRVLVLVFSASANDSPQVMREVERAVSQGIPIIPWRIEAVLPSKSLEFFLSAPHWLDALTPPLAKHLQLLGETVQLLLSRVGPRADVPGTEAAAPPVPPVAAARRGGSPKPTKPAARSSAPLVVGGAAAAVLLCVVIGVVALALSAPGTGTGRRAESTGGPTNPTDVSRSPRGGETADVEIARGVTMTFCRVPAGEAQLGSPKAERLEVLKQLKEEKEPEWLAAEAEEVRGKFKTKGFWLAKYPVTQEQWQALMGNNPSHFVPGQDDVKKDGITDTSRFPVESVSWDDDKDKEHSAQEYLKRMNAAVKVPSAMGQGKFVLPHEDEWEHACRGGKGNKQPFYFGDRLNGDKANCDGNFPYGTDKPGDYKKRTTEVGEYEGKAPHPWGLCDMHGNVWQWCGNLYEKDKESRVLRGGSWDFDAWICRAANRRRIAPGFRNYGTGCRPCFRLD